MIEILKNFHRRYLELNEILADPKVAASPEIFSKYAKELSEIGSAARIYGEYIELKSEIEELKTIDSPELQAEIEEEMEQKERRMSFLEEEAQRLVQSLDPNMNRNVIVEIRSGVGGQESAIFAGDLLRMYLRYSERHSLKAEILDSHPTELGGFKEVTFSVSGKGAYGLFKYESGVHRVQRVPSTEASGRIHTSTATVAVLPEADEVDIQVDPGDLRIDTFRSSGAGGQHVNRTESAVRITHLPTGVMVVCESERSQNQNRTIAMKILLSRILDIRQREEGAKIASMRKNQIGAAERSEKVRTYNFPQNRLTDHRNSFTTYRLEDIMDGGLDALVESLKQWEAESYDEFSGS